MLRHGCLFGGTGVIRYVCQVKARMPRYACCIVDLGIACFDAGNRVVFSGSGTAIDGREEIPVQHKVVVVLDDVWLRRWRISCRCRFGTGDGDAVWPRQWNFQLVVGCEW